MRHGQEVLRHCCLLAPGDRGDRLAPSPRTVRARYDNARRNFSRQSAHGRLLRDPLERKLGVKDDRVFLDGAPDDFTLEASTTTRLPRSITLALTFHTHETTLARRLPLLIERLDPKGAIWVCWPKKAAIKAQGLDADLDENVVREIGLAAGVVDVKVAAIDETWSGLKFVRRLADR